MKQFETDRVDALTVPCFYCRAKPGEQCTNTITNQPLTHLAAHWQRLKTAQEGIPF